MVGRVSAIAGWAAVAAVMLWGPPSPARAEPAGVVCWAPRGPGSEDGISPGPSPDDDPLGDLGAILKPVTADEMRAAPYKYVGKVAFGEGKHEYVATAAFIAPNLLVTAAHNLNDKVHGEVTRMAFYRASTAEDEFRNRFDIEAGAYLTAWRDNLGSEPDRYDFAVLRTKQSYDGGFLRVAAGEPPAAGTVFQIIAYSDVSEEDDDEEQMFHKAMRLRDADDGAYASRPADPGKGRAFTPGASGGVWLTDGGDLFSVEVSGRGQTEFGPVLDAGFGRVVEAATRCGR